MRQKSGILFGKNIANLIHHFFFSFTLLLVFVTTAADGAGYSCPTYRKYTSCNSGYYISNCPASSSSWTGQTVSSSSLTTGNSCKSCPSGYTCSGGLACPKKTQAATYQIQFNLNGGSGDTSPLTCTVGQTCDLYFHSYNYLWIYRAGYVLIGWSTTPSNPETATWTVSYSSPGSYTYYAVWEECPAGTYKDSSWHAIDSCQSCPPLSDGFYYNPKTAIENVDGCQQMANAADLDSNCSGGIVYMNAISSATWKDGGGTRYLAADPGSYIGKGMTMTVPAAGVGTFGAGYDFDNLCTQCTGATYSEGGTATSCTACPTTLPVEWRPGSGTGWDSYTDCYVYRNATSISSYCASGQLRRYASSASAWSSMATEYTAFRADPGAYVSGSGINMTCTQCGVGTYSSGGDIHACTACPELTPGFSYSATKGMSSYTECTQMTSDVSAVNQYCTSSVAAGEIGRFSMITQTAGGPNSWDGSTNVQSVAAVPGAILDSRFQDNALLVQGAYDINDMCTQCGVGEYSAGGNVKECTACPELTPGFMYNRATGMSSYTECLQATTDPRAANPNCMADDTADTVAILQTASSPTRWNGPVLAVGVVAKPGAILDSQFQDGILNIESGLYDLNNMCTICAGNTYSAGGTATSCTSCNRDYTISGTALTNHDSASDCKITCSGGEYVPTAGDGCVNVGAGYWGAGGTVSQTSTLGRNECASGLTTIGSGAGADEAGDCGRVLNVGDEKIYLRSTKKTTPSLNISINGDVFYGNMSTATRGALRINSGGTTYSVYDDSM